MKLTTSHDHKNGSDDPVVLMLHGFFGAPHNWRASAQGLSAHARVLVPQLPFFGVQHREDRLEHVVRFLGELLEGEQAGRVVAVGNSLGGQIAVSLALREPEKIIGLVLTGSSGLYENTGLHNTINRRPQRAWVRERIGEIFYDPAIVTEQMIDELLEISRDRHKAMDALLLAKSIRTVSVRELLPQVRCPVLLVWGENDPITPPDTAREFQSLLPDAELRFIPKCGHAAMMERPEEFNRLVEEFLRRLPARKMGI